MRTDHRLPEDPTEQAGLSVRTEAAVSAQDDRVPGGAGPGPPGEKPRYPK